MTPSRSVVMYWIRSERDSKLPGPKMDDMVRLYAEAFDALDVTLCWVSVDEIVIGVVDSLPVVQVRGERIHPETAFFHTMLMSSPKNRGDAWRHLTTYAALEAAGFFLTLPPLNSVINNDKFLTSLYALRGAGDPVPTLRVSTRGRWDAGGVGSSGVAQLADVTFPAVIKPIDWDGGNSVVRVEDHAELEYLLALASGAELTMAIQPCLGDGVVDCRVYCVDGEPQRMQVRRPSADGVAGNLGQGGISLVTDVREDLRAPARAVAAALGLSYLGVDFLVNDNQWWLSEVEVDAGSPDVPLAKLRFGSYLARFLEFRRAGAPTKCWQFTATEDEVA
jgi:hypothetical protein